jgi:hypothetical protein
LTTQPRDAPGTSLRACPSTALSVDACVLSAPSLGAARRPRRNSGTLQHIACAAAAALQVCMPVTLDLPAGAMMLASPEASSQLDAANMEHWDLKRSLFDNHVRPAHEGPRRPQWRPRCAADNRHTRGAAAASLCASAAAVLTSAAHLAYVRLHSSIVPDPRHLPRFWRK